MHKLDKNIHRIHKSTRTLHPRMRRIHNSLRMKSKTYYWWHMQPFASVLHWAILGIFIVFTLFVSASFFIPKQQEKSRASDLDISITGKATSLKTGAYLDFNASPYGSNVVVNDNTKLFSGYGWSEDLGWVAFGTDDNAEGPVSVDSGTGKVSGKAKVLNTGAYLDFINFNSNVFINNIGEFSGYVWSEDIGWLNFSANVYATGISFVSPAAPQNVRGYDVSDRSTSDYAALLRWQEPSVYDETDFKAYLVERSTDGSIYVQVSSTTSYAYFDTNVNNTTTYYYRVKTQYISGNTEVSSVVTVLPSGKFISAPTLKSGSLNSSSSATSVTVKWSTVEIDHPCTPRVLIWKFIGDNPETDVLYDGNGTSENVTDHTVVINGLASSTDYRYQALCTDVDGYTSTSDKYNLKTDAEPALFDISITDLNLTSAVINFKAATDLTSAKVIYDTSDAYLNSKESSNIAGGANNVFSIRLTDLTSDTKYYYRIVCVDQSGNQLRGQNSFTTPAKPVIRAVQLQPVADAAVTTYDVVWTSNVPISSSVVFSASGKASKSSAKGDLETEHTLRVEGLEDQATYSITVSGRDQFGNFAEYTAPSVTTPIDTRAPKLSNLTIEVRASGVGSTQKAQIIVSWETDEPSTSMVEYDQGISGDTYGFKSQQDQVYSTTHVVILSELEPSKIYHLRAVSSDKSGNQGSSPDTSAITGKTQKSIIDIILNSLINSFGWMGKIFK